ncbi:TRAF4 isoform 11, partial [Pan troglodytes]
FCDTCLQEFLSEGVFKCPEDQLPLDYAKVSPHCQEEAQAQSVALGGRSCWQPVGSGPVSTKSLGMVRLHKDLPRPGAGSTSIGPAYPLHPQ